MVNLKMEIPEGFLEEETRSGYTVKTEIKALWAVQMDLLTELMRVCKENGLTVFAGCGTLLGAIRHKGYIPWDDDIDVLMMRSDYDRLCEIGTAGAFKAPYFFQTEETDIGFTRSFARLRNSQTTAIQKTETGIRTRFNQGIFIDIFPLDYLPEDRAERDAFVEEAFRLRNKAIQWSSYTYRYRPLKERGVRLSPKELVRSFSGHCITPILKGLKIHNPYTRKLDRFSRKYGKTSKVGYLWGFCTDEDSSWDTADFENAMMHPFEMIEIPVPSGFMHLLEQEFGEWEKFVIGKTDHGGLIIDTDRSYLDYLANHTK